MQFRYYLHPGFINQRQIELIEAAKIVVTTCLQVRPGETVAIVTDSMQSSRISETLAMAVNLAEAEYVIVTMKPRRSMYGPKNVTEPPKPVAGALEQADAALLIGTTGIIWTDAGQNALRRGTRILSSPGISEDNFYRCVLIDYDEVWKVTEKLQEILLKGNVLSVTSPQGTSLKAELAYPPRWDCDGRVGGPGDFDFLPTGIAQFGFKENTAHGKIVIDGAFSRIGILREPIVMTVRNGRIIETSGGFEKREFLGLMDMSSDPNMYNLASIATGTNPNAKFVGVPNEDERVISMMCFFHGDNYNTYRGNNRARMCLVSTLTTPRLVIDGKVIVEKGMLKV